MIRDVNGHCSIMEEKLRLREQLWASLQHGGQSLAHGWGKAAQNVRRLRSYQGSQTLLISIDPVLRQIRLNALEDSKTIILPTPGLQKGFRILDPKTIPPAKRSLAVSASPHKFRGQPLPYDKAAKPRIDLVITDAVAVDTQGGRLGDGSGNLDIQFAILQFLGWLKRSVIVIAVVHESQIVAQVPTEAHDLGVHMIVSPSRVIQTSYDTLPHTGIAWDRLDQKKIRRNQILFRLYPLRGDRRSHTESRQQPNADNRRNVQPRTRRYQRRKTKSTQRV